MIHGGASIIRAPERYVDRFGGLSKRAVEAGGHLLEPAHRRSMSSPIASRCT